jgi:hypothetical protein
VGISADRFCFLFGTRGDLLRFLFCARESLRGLALSVEPQCIALISAFCLERLCCDEGICERELLSLMSREFFFGF